MAHFGGDMFEDFAYEADDIYNYMEPPKPSRKGEKAVKVTTNQSFAQIYNNRNFNGGCFTGESFIRMANGSKR